VVKYSTATQLKKSIMGSTPVSYYSLNLVFYVTF